MADLTPKDRLQPSLLDRLTDDDPSSRQESRQERVLSVRQYRAAVLRDLAWLMNASSQRLSEEDLENHPYVAQSTLNFGIPDLTGRLTSSVIPAELEQQVLDAVKCFEPRIMSNTLKIRVRAASEDLGNHSMAFEIEGELWAKPLPEALFLKTEMDLETGQCTVEDRSNG
jgi:type VI secretion system protein ImpF